MEIVIKTYNLKEIKNQVIKHCVENNPKLTLAEIAKKLGVAERTLYRVGLNERKKQCRDGYHRPFYCYATGGLRCRKCDVLLNDFSKEYKDKK